MPNLRSAFLCVLSAVILFSCNSKTKSKLVQHDLPVNDSRVVPVLPEEAIGMSAYHTKFIENITQHFSVSSKRVSLIKSRGGLKITVNPGVLEKESGSAIEGNIDISVIELTNVNDLFKSNAATVSNDRLLVSGGSYFIGMKNGEDRLRIKDGKTLQVEFPLLKKDEMELFYGQRDELNNMNWEPAKIPLEKQDESVSFTDKTPWETNSAPAMAEWSPAKVYRSLNEEVYYYKTKMTIKKLVDTINSRNAKVYLQTISFWPKNLPTDRRLDTNFLITMYGPKKQYILKLCKDEEKEKCREQEAFEKWQPVSLAGQLQKYYSPGNVKYYAPSNINSLGWTNCDRFYNPSRQAETELELPYAFNNSRIEYFVIFNSFNGLMSGRVLINENTKFVLRNLPMGEDITLIAFTKKNGIIYQAKEDLVIGKNKTSLVNFKEISEDEMNKMFGSNVKI